MYKNLLLSHGGGIQRDHTKAVGNDNSTLVIGVGGTGVNVLSELKEKVHRKLSPETDGSNIGYLAIDIDEVEFRERRLDEGCEFIKLFHPRLVEEIWSQSWLYEISNRPEFEWFDTENISKVPETLNIFSCGIRQMGRFLIVKESRRIYEKIRNAIMSIILGRNAYNLTIHIIASLAGATGGGGFIDVCYIVRKVLEDLAIEAAVLEGYFFLPDVHTTTPYIATNPISVSHMEANGYAALRELEFLMDLRANQGNFKQLYEGFVVDTDMEPVDAAFLISSNGQEGNVMRDAKKYCTNLVVECIFDQLVKDEEYFTFRSVLSNCGQQIRMLQPQEGLCNKYHILGASKAEIPFTRIDTYLATKLYKEMRAHLKRTPTVQEAHDFVEQKVYLNIAGIKRMLAKNVYFEREVPCPEMSMVKNITGFNVHSQEILQPMNEWLCQQEGIIENNFRGLDAELDQYRYEPHATSLIGILYNKLIECALDPSYGPYYAIGMLNRIGKDSDGILHSLCLEVNRFLQDLKRQVDFHSNLVEELKCKFTSATLFKRKSAYDTYRRQVGIWYRSRLEVTWYCYFERLIQGLIIKTHTIYNQYFGPMKLFLDKFDDTFVENEKYFSDALRVDSSNKGFVTDIIEFSDIKPHLDALLAQENPAEATVEMIKFFLDNSDEWLSGDEDRITCMMTRFVTLYFYEEMNKNGEEYFAEKYSLKNGTENDLFDTLMDASEPMFWSEPLMNAYNCIKTIYLSCPADVHNIVEAANDFSKTYLDIYLRKCFMGDGIFMKKIYSGFTLSRYKRLEIMKECYDRSNKTGIQILGKDSGNWLPTLIPLK